MGLNKDFLKSSDFNTLYKKLPKTGTDEAEFANFIIDDKTPKIFKSHFERISLINCHNLPDTEEPSSSPSLPNISATPLFSGPAALKLAQEGKKVAVLIFADSTNVGGILITGGRPAGTQEEQTVLMAPEIYSYLGNNYGVHDIGGNGDGIYGAKQKRYCLEKESYEKPDIINPAYGYILTNLLMTHDINVYSDMVKLPKDKVVEVSYIFLSMPSFSTGVSRDPVGAVLIGQSGEKDGEIIYQNMEEALSSLYRYKEIVDYLYSKKWNITLKKIAIFYSYKKLQEFAEKYLGGGRSISNIIAEVIKASIYFEKGDLSEEALKKQLNIDDMNGFREDVESIIKESQKNYESCILTKFTNLVKGSEAAGADTLILGRVGCGAFMNDENEISAMMGKALATCKTIKHIYFAGLREGDPFVEKVKKSMFN